MMMTMMKVNEIRISLELKFVVVVVVVVFLQCRHKNDYYTLLALFMVIFNDPTTCDDNTTTAKGNEIQVKVPSQMDLCLVTTE